MFKIVRIFFGIALVGATAGFLFIGSNDFNYDFTGLDLNKDKIASTTASTIRNTKTKASDLLSVALEEAKNKGNELISFTTEKAKEYAFNILKKEVEKKIEELGEKAGLDINSLNDSLLKDDVVAYSVKKGQSAYFTIKNNKDGLLKYKIDWLDGEIEEGDLVREGESVVLSHIWFNSGEYLLTFKTINSEEERQHKVLISVF
jgi:vacuolar-type H+-ATPase subunit H